MIYLPMANERMGDYHYLAVGDRVRVLPEYDERYANRTGIVIEMIPHDYGSYPVVRFDDTGEKRSFDWSGVEIIEVAPN